MSGARDVCTWCMHVWCPCLEEGSLGSLFGGDQIPLSPCEAIVWCVCIVAPPAFARLGLLARPPALGFVMATARTAAQDGACVCGVPDAL